MNQFNEDSVFSELDSCFTLSDTDLIDEIINFNDINNDFDLNTIDFDIESVINTPNDSSNSIKVSFIFNIIN